jgi:uncharacterized membrane-anchored protein
MADEGVDRDPGARPTTRALLHNESWMIPSTASLKRLLPLLLLLAAAHAEAPPAPAIRWQFGPRTLTLTGLGALPLPSGMIAADRAEARRFLEATGNPPAGDEIAIAAPANLDWFLVFSFDEFKKLGLEHPRPSVAEIVAALKRGNSETNQARKKAGRETLDLLGWREKPSYDAKTFRLEWSIDTQESGGRHDANRFWLLLTRNGVLTIELVTEQPRYAAASQSANALLQKLGIAEQEAYDDPDERNWLAIGLGVCAALLPLAGFTVLYFWGRRKKNQPPALEP